MPGGKARLLGVIKKALIVLTYFLERVDSRQPFRKIWFSL